MKNDILVRIKRFSQKQKNEIFLFDTKYMAGALQPQSFVCGDIPKDMPRAYLIRREKEIMACLMLYRIEGDEIQVKIFSRGGEECKEIVRNLLLALQNDYPDEYYCFLLRPSQVLEQACIETLGYCHTISNYFMKKEISSLEREVEQQVGIQIEVDGEINDCSLYLIQEEREIAYASMQIEGETASLFDVYVEEEVRRQGLGRQLILHCIRLLQKENVTKILIHVANEPAKQFYSHLGFEVIDQYDFYEGTK